MRIGLTSMFPEGGIFTGWQVITEIIFKCFVDTFVYIYHVKQKSLHYLKIPKDYIHPLRIFEQLR